MNAKFEKSEFIKTEYSCEVVTIGELTPIEGSDFLVKTEIHPGIPVVVRKDEVHTGDVMFYVDLECQINEKFLHVNNQFSDEELNQDTAQKGFFNKHGRVRMVRLRGQESMGYLFGYQSMNNYLTSRGIQNISYKEMEEMAGSTVFDSVNGEIFVQAYVPKVNIPVTVDKAKRRNKKLKLFDRMIPGEFSFHYDTDQLEKNIHKIQPDDVVDLSIKLHGTSAIFAHIPVKRQLSVWEKIKKFFGAVVPLTEYDHIYSSRSVIKNQYINKKVTSGYYGEDIWGYWNEIFGKYVPRDYTVYGELIGFTPNGTAIQKVGKSIFDYGCPPKVSKLMIYRISQSMPDGSTYEWNVSDVREWTEMVIEKLRNEGNYDLAAKIHPIDIVYHGTLRDLYPEIPVDGDWGKNIVHALANESRFLMEQNEPMCRNAVPREGLVLRKMNDPLKEAFKLKTMKFRNKEAKAIDDGEVDIEMQAGYGSNE